MLTSRAGAVVTAILLSCLLVSCGSESGGESGDEEQDRATGFEIFQTLPDASMRAWISPEITYEAFVALEVPAGWRKNQPRTRSDSSDQGGTTSRFLRSPDAEVEGELLIEEHFGFRWFHAATIIEFGVPIDPTGLLFAARVRKFHEIVFEPGSRIVILQSPEDDLYFRIGRDADRTDDQPEIPEGWRLLEATTPESFVILLAPENLVIRTPNQDSFQGPVPDLSSLL